MGIDEQILELVCIGSTLQDDVSAEMRRLRDGSGLILPRVPCSFAAAPPIR
jgi:hypothetical protein